LSNHCVWASPWLESNRMLVCTRKTKSEEYNLKCKAVI